MRFILCALCFGMMFLSFASYASSKYDLKSIVGDQVLTSNLLLRGMFLDEVDIKLDNAGFLGFALDIEKRKLPFGYPQDDFAFDIIVDGKKIGRTSLWFEWDIDDVDGVRVQHVFSDAELDILFTLAPLSGKKLELSNDNITLTGDLRKK